MVRYVAMKLENAVFWNELYKMIPENRAVKRNYQNRQEIKDFRNQFQKNCLHCILYPVSGKREDVSTIFSKVIKIYIKRLFSKNVYLTDTSISYNQYGGTDMLNSSRHVSVSFSTNKNVN